MGSPSTGINPSVIALLTGLPLVASAIFWWVWLRLKKKKLVNDLALPLASAFAGYVILLELLVIYFAQIDSTDLQLLGAFAVFLLSWMLPLRGFELRSYGNRSGFYRFTYWLMFAYPLVLLLLGFGFLVLIAISFGD